LVNAWLRLERAYLKLRLFLQGCLTTVKNKNGEVRDALLHHSDRGTPRDEAMRNNFLYCFKFFDPTGLVAALPLGPALFCRLLPQHHTQEPRFGVE